MITNLVTIRKGLHTENISLLIG